MQIILYLHWQEIELLYQSRDFITSFQNVLHHWVTFDLCSKSNAKLIVFLGVDKLHYLRLYIPYRFIQQKNADIKNVCYWSTQHVKRWHLTQFGVLIVYSGIGIGKRRHLCWLFLTVVFSQHTWVCNIQPLRLLGPHGLFVLCHLLVENSKNLSSGFHSSVSQMTPWPRDTSTVNSNKY